MVVDGCWVAERACGEGDLGGVEGSGGASTGGSSTTVVLCEGVWLRDETCVTVGDTAASKSVPAHRTERINPARSYWATTRTRPKRSAENHGGPTWRGRRLRQRRGRELVSPDHCAVAMREPGEALRQRECSVWQGEALRHCQMERAYWGASVLGATAGAASVCAGRRLLSIAERGGRDWAASSPQQRRASHGCSSTALVRMRMRTRARIVGDESDRRPRRIIASQATADGADWWRRQTAAREIGPGHDLQDQHIRGSTRDESACMTGSPAASRCTSPKCLSCDAAVEARPLLLAHST
jgi:hypothetical protein